VKFEGNDGYELQKLVVQFIVQDDTKISSLVIAIFANQCWKYWAAKQMKIIIL